MQVTQIRWIEQKSREIGPAGGILRRVEVRYATAHCVCGAVFQVSEGQGLRNLARSVVVTYQICLRAEEVSLSNS